jgi:hypothetical protein
MCHNDFLFYFVGGTCGSFAKAIFARYLDIKLNQPIEKILIDPELGHCHDNHRIVRIKHVHWLKHIDPQKQLVVIDFDEDDQTSIVKMAVNKVVQFQIQKDANFLINRWGSVFADKKDLRDIEKIFIDNPNFLIFSEWKTFLDSLNPVLVLTYKDIIFGDLNKKISDFFELSPSPEIDEIISQYRACNRKYIYNEKL